ncbi:MAG: SNF2-related protein, partial [Vicinamibacterales bacterium]
RTSLDWRFMASVTGDHTVTDERIAALREALAASGRVFEQPDGSWVLAEEYLSGDVVTKLADAELAAADAPGRFDRNLAALREIVPEHKAISQIAPTLGANWIPPEFIGHFVADLLGVETPFRGLELDSTQAIVRWRVAFDYDAIRAGKEHELAVPYGQLLDEKTGKKSHLAGVTDLIEAALNLESPTLGHTIDVGDSKKFIRDEDATLAARANIEELRERFMEWVQSTPEAAETIAGIYNTRFNRNVARRFDGSHLAAYDAEGNRTAALPGLSLPFQLFPHQLRAIWRILTSGNTLLAHEVGAGKTFEMIAAAMEMRRTGRARKPMITVPTHLLGSWRADILKAYPAAKVLAFDEQDLAAGKRKEAMARIAYGDWDIVLVPQSSFGLLKVSPARMIKTMEAMVDELVALIVANKGDVSVKKFERIKRKLEDKIAKKLAAVKKGDDALYWEELGVDALLVDEAHNFKNLFFFTELENIRGLSRSEADKSLDLFIKIQDINQASNHRNVVLATATPVMNSIAELYTMQRYLQPQTLETQGFSAFDNWYRTFGHAAPNVEQRPDGTYHEVMRLKKFRNLDLLYRTVSDVMDYVGWDDMPYLDLPKLAGGRVEVVETPPHPMYPKVKAWFADRLAALRETPPHVDREGNYIAPERMHPLTGKPLGRKDNILAVMNDAKLAAIDVRLVLGGGVKDFPESRIQTAAKLMAETYKREKARKGVLLAFLDVGTPKGTDLEPLEFLRGATVEDETAGGALGTEDVEGDDDLDLGETGDFNLYGALKAALVKRGIPPAEIAFIHQARNAAERLALFDALNAGTVRVLVASSEKGGTGMNIQQRLAETLHIDAPRFMRPGDLRQREGRMIRQGNSYKEVTLRRFITPGTTDEWLYGLLMSKQSAISEFMRGNLTEYTEEDPSSISIEEAQARSANDPRVVELTTLRGQIKRLEAQASAAQRATAAARETLATAPLALAAAQKKLTAIEAWKKASFKSLRGSDFEITVGDQTYTKRADANTALIQALKEMLDEAPLTPERPYSSSKRSPVAYVGTVRGLPLMAYVTEWVGDRKVVLSLDTSSVAGGGHHTQPVAEVSDLSADGTPFGEGRDLVASVVSDYDGLGTLGGWTQREIDDLEATIARARKIVDTPSDVIEKAIRARARIGEIEAALKAEGEERDKQADADRKLRKAEEERRKKEADLAAAQAAEDDDDAGSGPLAMAAGPPVTPRPQGATARTGGAP